ncbi:MAG: nucleotidyltransferase domain-containing protein [Myxococcales bacterium]|nr:nucleotidyltransferase domain-containing protein [Myxococcales bacterium]
MINPEMRARIVHELAELERAEQVVILYACESGSRAWGFPSPDSDYDVRFVYARPRDWYLSLFLEHRRDVIERPIDALLDIGGWDLRKAMRLLAGSNAPLCEWLQSPIVYLERHELRGALRPAMHEHFSPVGAGFHYRSLARKAHAAFSGPADSGAAGSLKKLCYALRSALAARWIQRGLGVPPMELAPLVDRLIEDADVRADIQRLVTRKAALDERALVERDGPTPRYVAALLEQLATADFERPDKGRRSDALDPVFRGLLRAASGGETTS